MLAVLATFAVVATGSSVQQVSLVGAKQKDGNHAKLRERLRDLERRVAALEGSPPPATPGPTSPPTSSPTRTPTASPTASQPPAPSPTTTPSGTPTSSPTSSPTRTPTPTQTPTPTPTTPTQTPSAPATGSFPTPQTTGVPAGWTPLRTIDGNYTVSTAGATVTDLRINGDLIVTAKNVTIRRVEVVGGRIDNYTGRTCATGLTVADSTIRRGTRATTDSDQAALGVGGYTATNVLIDGLPEGFRVGGAGACGPVSISNSYARVTAPDQCRDWHGDGLQGYDGDALTLRNTVLILEERTDCYGTAPFFYPSNQGNTSVDIDGLVVSGGGYSFRLGMPGNVRNLAVVDNWVFGPVDVKCSVVSSFSARTTSLTAQGQPSSAGRVVGCTGEGN